VLRQPRDTPIGPVLVLTLSMMFVAHASVSASSEGEAIYRSGSLPEGKPLTAHREGSGRISGAEAACANCHRRSGLGSRESRISIPPIAGPYLFRSMATRESGDFDLPFVESIHLGRAAYTDATLARAIRDGMDVDGKPFSYLMPRYELNDADMAALIGYLKSLGGSRVPGVTETVLHFATIITPDADPAKKAAFLSVLSEFFKDKNAFFRGESPRLRSSRKVMFRVSRMWQLHVWQLGGPPSSWEAQLREHLKAEPVFAVISGLAGETWEPVQQFCEDEAIPCLFPNVDSPSTGRSNGYSVFFSQGVQLEADLIAREITRRPGLASARLVQVFRPHDAGEAAARSLAEKMQSSGVAVWNQVLPATPTKGDVATAVKVAKQDDVLALWLRPEDVAALGPAGGVAAVYASSVMAGPDQPPFPADWRAQTRLAYPFDLPSRRRVPVDYALGWFKIRRIPVTNLHLQADTFLACGILAETLGHMVDAFVRDYLIERMEDMIARRLVTGYYPHLSLGPGQRFASKGGYIVRFATAASEQFVADGEWTVP
jgi:cytochrome c553